MITASQLAAMRAVAAAGLVGQCRVWRPLRADTPRGGQQETWQAVATLPWRLAPAAVAPAEVVAAGQPVATQAFRAVLPAEADVRQTDELEDLADGQRYRVTGVRGPWTWEVLRVVELVRVAG